MTETNLWKSIKPFLAQHGMFQKISDRFTGGIPDVLGAVPGRGVAIELKDLCGVHRLSTSFRPGQLDWLRDWELGGGVSILLSTSGRARKLLLHAHPWTAGEELESGASLDRVVELSLKTWVMSETRWPDAVEDMVARLMTKRRISL